MRINTLQRSIVILLVYVAFLFGVVAIQFTRRSRTQENLGGLALSLTTREPGAVASGEFPPELKLVFRGFGLMFGRDHSLSVSLANGDRAVVVPKSYATVDQRVRVVFERGVAIDFQARDSGKGYSISPIFQDASVQGIELPFFLANASLTEIRGREILLRSSLGAYQINLAQGSHIDSSSHLLYLSSLGGGFSLSEKKIEVAMPQPKQERKFPQTSASDLDEQVSDYLDKAFAGVTAGRYVPDQGAWKYGDETRFSEDALMLLAAEAYRRNQYLTYSTQINGILKTQESGLGWRSAAYFGNLVRRSQSYYAEANRSLAAIMQLAQNANPALFERGDLSFALYNQASLAQRQAVLAYVKTVTGKGLSIKQAVGYLAAAIQSEDYDAAAESSFVAMDSLVEQAIAPAVKLAQGKAFLSDAGTIDVTTQVLAGRALMSYGDKKASATYANMGRSLLSAVLGLADANGMLPARGVYAEDGPENLGGLAAPESLYALVISNPYYPHAISLSKDFRRPIFIWTCAPETSYAKTDTSLVIKMRFAVGSTHFASVFGLPTFSEIKLYDIPYSPDAEFESYNVSGYLYTQNPDALFVKMKHKAEVESIQLAFP
jgi:hypothetical protein